MEELYTIQLTKQQVEQIFQILSQVPYFQVAPLINRIGAQVGAQEAERAQHQSSTGKVNGGSSPRSDIREQGGSATGSGEGIQSS